MATATFLTNDVSSTVGINSEFTTYKVYAAPENTDGRIDEGSIIATSREKAIAALDAKCSDPENKLVLYIEQPFKTYSFGSEEAFREAIPDAETRLARINAACSTVQNSKILSLLKAMENGRFVFEPTEEPYDAIELLRESPKRTFQSPAEKIIKSFSAGNFTPEQIKAAMAALGLISAA